MFPGLTSSWQINPVLLSPLCYANIYILLTFVCIQRPICRYNCIELGIIALSCIALYRATVRQSIELFLEIQTSHVHHGPSRVHHVHPTYIPRTCTRDGPLDECGVHGVRGIKIKPRTPRTFPRTPRTTGVSHGLQLVRKIWNSTEIPREIS